MDIGIIGAGSVGMLIAAYLGREHNVNLYVRRKDQKDQLLKYGVGCDRIDGNIPVNASLIGEIRSDHDVLFVTVKQNEINQVLGYLPPCFADMAVIFLQNGMGHLDKLPVKDYRCWVGVVEHGALKMNDTYVRHTGVGKIQVANIQAETGLEKVISALCEQDFWFESHDDYYEMLSSKLMINAVINPLTAIFRLNNRAIHENPYIQSLARHMCQEACSALGRSFDQDWPRVLSVASNTGENKSSMLKDILENRKTEIEAITGYILNKSVQPLPYHKFVLQAINAIEIENGEFL